MQRVVCGLFLKTKVGERERPKCWCVQMLNVCHRRNFGCIGYVAAGERIAFWLRSRCVILRPKYAAQVNVLLISEAYSSTLISIYSTRDQL